jgi:protein-tyrosine phosphatase
MTESPSFHIDSRLLPLSGAVNFRDIGGNLTTKLRLVKKGLLFRSDHLSRLTHHDQQTLQRLNFKTACDLRSKKEQHKAPDLLPEDGSIRFCSLPVQAQIFDPATAMELIKAGNDSWLTMDFLIKLYLSYLDDFGPVWGEVLKLASSPDNLPLVFHCTGGKDRTGICAALLLKFLGVEEDRIFADHDLSNACNAQRLKPLYVKFAEFGIGPEKAALYLQAPMEPLVAMFNHLKRHHGTVADYLIMEGGLDRTTLTSLQTVLLQ